MRRNIQIAALLGFATSLPHAAPAQVNFRAADLKLRSEAMNPGQNVSFTAKIQNNGRQHFLGTVGWGFYLSENETITSRDLLLRSGTVGKIARFQTVSISSSFFVPLNQKPGVQYAGFLADHRGVFRETREDDNDRAVRVFVNRLPDLRIMSRTVVNPVKAGGTLDVVVTVKNVGNVPVGRDLGKEVLVGAFLGQLVAPRTSDLFMGATKIGLLPGQSVTRRIRATVPAHLRGRWFVHTIADYPGQFREISERNNRVTDSRTIEPRLAPLGARLHWLPRLNSIAFGATSAQVHSTRGGQGDLVLHAPSEPNAGYILYWNCSGKPFDFDTCAQLSFGLIGTPLLPGWMGKVDANGSGAAQVAIPRLPPTRLDLSLHGILVSPDLKTTSHTEFPARLRVLDS